MKPRFTDQDVAALYCAMRDRVCAVQRHENFGITTRWTKLLDALFPWRASAIQRRLALAVRRNERLRLQAAADVYREWQEARPAPDEPVDIQPLNHSATAMALHMVRSQRRGEHYAPHVSVTVRDESVNPR